MRLFEKELEQYHLDNEKAIMKELEKQYKAALKAIDEKVAALLGRSDADLQNVIFQIEHQKALREQVAAILDQLHSNEFESISDYLSKCYQDGFLGAMYSVHNQGIPVIVPVDPQAAVRAVITDSKLSADLYTELGVDIKKLKTSIRHEISRGIAGGLSYNEITRNISNASKAPLSRARTIVRTEAHRIQEASSYDAQKAAINKGAEVVKQWDATLDGNTRPTHRKLDGQLKEVDEPFEMDGKKAMYPGDFGRASEDCNCRCRSLTRAKWALDEDELQTLKDRAAFFGLDKTKDFEEFEKKYLKAAKTLENTGKSDKIEMHRKAMYSDRKNVKPVSEKRFNELTIEARKNGANVIRASYDSKEFEHLVSNGALASCLGDTLIFRPDATISEVLEETYHFMQNLNGLNDDKDVQLRFLLNEIDAQEYLLSNARKYSIPKIESEETKALLEEYKQQLQRYMGET